MFFGRRPLSTGPLSALAFVGAHAPALPILFRVRDRSGPAFVTVTVTPVPLLVRDRSGPAFVTVTVAPAPLLVRDRSGPAFVTIAVYPVDLLMTELGQ